MKLRPLSSLLLPMLVVLVACATGGPSAPSQSTAGGSSPGQPQRTLQVAIRVEPAGMGTRSLVQAGVALYLTKRMFNAEIALLDPDATPHPYLVESLPRLNSDDWQVFPDGRMETTHHLKPNVAWHDGTPLSASDFLFAYQVFATPELGQANLPPFTSIEDVSAPDDRTLIIHWRRPYP